MSINRKIARATLVVGFYTLLGKIFTMGKEIATAACFGPGELLDAYLMALVLPIFLVNILGSTLGSAFLPTYVQVKRNDGREAAQRLFSTALTWTLIFLMALSVLLFWGAPIWLSWLAKGFGPAKMALTLQLLYWTMPQLLLRSIAGLWQVVMNAEERFAVAAMAPALVALGELAGLWVLFRTWGIYSLALGALVGCAVQTLMLMRAVSRQGLSIRLGWQPRMAAVRQVGRQFLPMMAGAVFANLNTTVNQVFASWLPAGSISSLSFASKVVSLLTQLLSLALATSLLTYFSQQVAAADHKGIIGTLNKTVLFAIWGIVPLTTFLFIFAEPLMMLLFQRGQFNPGDTLVVGQTFRLLALQLPVFAIGMIGVRLISAFKQNQILMAIAGVNACLNLGLSYWWLHLWGVSGIALSASVTYSLSAVQVLVALRARFRLALSHQTWIQIGLWGLAGTALAFLLTPSFVNPVSVWTPRLWINFTLWLAGISVMGILSLYLSPYRYILFTILMKK
jgi:putative peptidoglycan lipid II flippase